MHIILHAGPNVVFCDDSQAAGVYDDKPNLALSGVPVADCKAMTTTMTCSSVSCLLAWRRVRYGR